MDVQELVAVQKRQFVLPVRNESMLPYDGPVLRFEVLGILGVARDCAFERYPKHLFSFLYIIVEEEERW